MWVMCVGDDDDVGENDVFVDVVEMWVMDDGCGRWEVMMTWTSRSSASASSSSSSASLYVLV